MGRPTLSTSTFSGVSGDSSHKSITPSWSSSAFNEQPWRFIYATTSNKEVQDPSNLLNGIVKVDFSEAVSNSKTKY